MAKIQGMVLKVEKHHVVIVTDDGEFKRISMPQNTPLPGDVIQVPFRSNNYKPYIAIATILLLLIGFSLGNYYGVPEAYAAVSLDMTPSIELTVNKDNVIIEAKAHNDEGIKLLNQINLNSLDVYEAVNMITWKAGEMGFFNSKDKNLVLATVVPLQNKTKELTIDEEKIMDIIHDEMYNQKFDGYVVVNNSETTVRNEAQQAGLSINQYLLLEKSKEQGIEITPERLKTDSPTQIMYESNLEVSNMFPNNWCEVRNKENIHGPIEHQQNPIYNSPLKSSDQNTIPNDKNNNSIQPNYNSPSNSRNNWRNYPWSNNSDHCNW